MGIAGYASNRDGQTQAPGLSQIPGALAARQLTPLSELCYNNSGSVAAFIAIAGTACEVCRARGDMNCPNCGQPLLTGTRLCSHCGAEISGEQEHSPGPDLGTILDAEPAPYLLITAGPARGQVFELRGEVSLGRSRINSIALSDGKVSRNHAKLDPVRNTYILTDLGSANGTFVNGVRVTQPVRLRDGDSLQVGDTQLIFHASPAAYSPEAGRAASYPAPRPGPTARPSPVPSSYAEPTGGGSKLPTWVWVGCAVLIVLASLLVVVALTTGILIGQGLGGG